MSKIRLSRLFPVAILGIVLATLAVVQGAGSDEQRVAVLIPGSVRFFDIQLDAMEETAEREGLVLTTFDAGWDVATQISQIQRAADLGFDLIAVAGVDRSIDATLTRVHTAYDIPIITFTNAVAAEERTIVDGVAAHVGRSEERSGELLAEQVQALGLINPRVLLIEGSPDTAPQVLRTQGFLGTLFADDAAEQAEEKVTRFSAPGWDLGAVELGIVTRFEPGSYDVIATHWADAAVIVSRYLDSIDAPHVPIVTLEWTESLVNEMDRGRIVSSTYFEIAEEGARTIDIAATILRGETVEHFVEIGQTVVDAQEARRYGTEW